MFEEIFKNKEPNHEKLLKFGFKYVNEDYVYITNILQEEFILEIKIKPNRQISTKVLDNKTGEEYVLYLVKDAVGEFVGRIKENIAKVLQEVCEKCFDDDKNEQLAKIVEYIKNKYGDELEFLWPKFPTDGIWRRKDNNKWYALIMELSRRKLGFDSDEVIEIMDLRIEPENMSKLVDKERFFEGYHMNKKHWFTICLDGTLDEIYQYIDNSYILAKK